MNTVNLLFELLGKTNCREAVTAAGQYLGTAIYPLYRGYTAPRAEGCLLRGRGGLLRQQATPRCCKAARLPRALGGRRQGTALSAMDARRDADRQLPPAQSMTRSARRRRAANKWIRADAKYQ